jgi:hypothetical protein
LIRIQHGDQVLDGPNDINKVFQGRVGGIRVGKFTVICTKPSITAVLHAKLQFEVFRCLEPFQQALPYSFVTLEP